MRYDLFISNEARQQLRALDPELRRNVGFRLDRLADNLSGDVKKLTAIPNGYRLRVGSVRVLFRLAGARIEVYAVKQRQSAYE